LSVFLLAMVPSSQLLGKILDAAAVSFLVVSLSSLIGDQEILNHLPEWISIDPTDPRAKAAIKDGKSINLLVTALLQLVATIIMLVT